MIIHQSHNPFNEDSASGASSNNLNPDSNNQYHEYEDEILSMSWRCVTCTLLNESYTGHADQRCHACGTPGVTSANVQIRRMKQRQRRRREGSQNDRGNSDGDGDGDGDDDDYENRESASTISWECETCTLVNHHISYIGSRSGGQDAVKEQKQQQQQQLRAQEPRCVACGTPFVGDGHLTQVQEVSPTISNNTSLRPSSPGAGHGPGSFTIAALEPGSVSLSEPLSGSGSGSGSEPTNTATIQEKLQSFKKTVQKLDERVHSSLPVNTMTKLMDAWVGVTVTMVDYVHVRVMGKNMYMNGYGSSSYHDHDGTFSSDDDALEDLLRMRDDGEDKVRR